jgi:hypothetical protein
MTSVAFEKLGSAGDVAFWQWGDVIAIWQKGVYSIAAAEYDFGHARLRKSYPAGVRMMVIVDPGAPPPEDAVRKRIANFDPSLQRALAGVTLATGFRAALVTSVVSGLMTLARSRTPMRAFSTTREAAQWLGTFATPDDGPQLAAALDALVAK